MSVPAEHVARHIAAVRGAAAGLIAALDAYRAARPEWDNRDYFNALTDADFVGPNAGLTKAQFAAALSSLEAIEAWVRTNNHDDALYVVRS